MDQHAGLRAPRVLRDKVCRPRREVPRASGRATTPATPWATALRRRYGGYCAYAVSKGKLVTVDPDVYVVLDEKLFLFSNEEARTAFENEEPGIVQVADGKWAELESERAQKKGCFSCF